MRLLRDDDVESTPRGDQLASSHLLDLVLVPRRGRTIVTATPGSEELRYLNFEGANANVGGPDLRHIVLREDVRLIEVYEEFLHGTQSRCGILERLGRAGAEVHVKEFMIRHRRLLGLSDRDIVALIALLGRR